MKIKHKLLSDYQYTSPDKKIFLIKAGTIIDEYSYKLKGDSIPIDKEIVEANPQIFDPIDWKSELMTYMKANKMPQPAQLGKKLIPFIEEMILASMTKMEQPTGVVVDETKIKELERKETDLKNREKRISDKEEEIDIRLKRVEKREESHKEDLKELDKKEDQLRERSKELTEKQLDIEDKLQDINERERNLDRSLLESAKDIDAKYDELQKKIDKDLRVVSEREKDLEVLSKQLKKREERINQLEAELSDRLRNIEIRTEEIKLWESDVNRLDVEIKNWEKLHWKLQRMNPPPSAII